MTRNTLVFLATLGSIALIAGAFVFQFLGYLPCQMCHWQRWPHYAAIVIGLAALQIQGRALPALGALATAATSALGVFHTGVERKLWDGPSSCTGGGNALTGDLLSLDGPQLIMCDQVSWEFLTLSMPSWNALFSAAICILWIMAYRRS